MEENEKMYQNMEIPAGQAKKMIVEAIRADLLKVNGEYLIPRRNRIPLYLFGAPGIGKTEVVRQAADSLGIGFVSFSLTHHTRNSILGLPVISNLEGERYTEYTMSEIIAEVMKQTAAGYTEGILQLDEFNCISETILPVMLEFLQTGKIGTHLLPEGWIPVLCGNPVEYNKSARSFDAAVMDRVRLIRVVAEYGDFAKYAEEKDFHPAIREFLKNNRERLYRVGREKSQGKNTPGLNGTMPSGEEEVVTPRSWENLSWALKAYEQAGSAVDEGLVLQFIKSEHTAHEFCRYYSLHREAFTERDTDRILSGCDTEEYIRIIKKKPIAFRWTVTDALAERLISETQNCISKADGAKRKEEISRMISEAFRFIVSIEDAGQSALQEKLFAALSERAEIGKLMMHVKNEEYLHFCERSYGMERHDKTA